LVCLALIDEHSFHYLAVLFVEYLILFETNQKIESFHLQTGNVLIGDNSEDGRGIEVELSFANDRPLRLHLPVSHR